MSLLSTIFGYETRLQKRLKNIEQKIHDAEFLLCRLEVPYAEFKPIGKLLSEVHGEILFIRCNLWAS